MDALLGSSEGISCGNDRKRVATIWTVETSPPIFPVSFFFLSSHFRFYFFYYPFLLNFYFAIRKGRFVLVLRQIKFILSNFKASILPFLCHILAFRIPFWLLVRIKFCSAAFNRPLYADFHRFFFFLTSMLSKRLVSFKILNIFFACVIVKLLAKSVILFYFFFF